MGHTPVHFLVLSCRTSPRLQVTYCEFLKFCKLSCEQLFLTAWSCRFPYLWPLKKIVSSKALMFQDLISFLTSGVDIFTNNPLTLQISGYIFLLAFGDETNPFYHLVFKHIYGWDASMCLYCLPVPFLKGIRVNYIWLFGQNVNTFAPVDPNILGTSGTIGNTWIYSVHKGLAKIKWILEIVKQARTLLFWRNFWKNGAETVQFSYSFSL